MYRSEPMSAADAVSVVAPSSRAIPKSHSFAPSFAKQQVARLHVPVDEAARVHRAQRREHPPRQPLHLRRRSGPSASFVRRSGPSTRSIAYQQKPRSSPSASTRTTAGCWMLPQRLGLSAEAGPHGGIRRHHRATAPSPRTGPAARRPRTPCPCRRSPAAASGTCPRAARRSDPPRATGARCRAPSPPAPDPPPLRSRCTSPRAVRAGQGGAAGGAEKFIRRG